MDNKITREQAGETPASRIRCFIHTLIANKAKIKLYGCPVGSLCAELASWSTILTKREHSARPSTISISTVWRALTRAMSSDCSRMRV